MLTNSLPIKTAHKNDRNGHMKAHRASHAASRKPVATEADLLVLASHSRRHYYILDKANKMADKGRVGVGWGGGGGSQNEGYK